MSHRNRGRTPIARHAGVHQDQNKRHPSSAERHATHAGLNQLAESLGVEFNIAWDRPEHEACQRGTPGCCVDHPVDRETSCETW